MNTTRRDFLKVGAGAVAATSGVSPNSKEIASPTASGERTEAPAGEAADMIYRKFGSTDAHISAIGVGGHHLGDVATLDEAVQLVQEAIDAGVTFFDNAWEYYNGKTETILGRALRDGRRDKVFLMTKVCTHGRSGKLAMQMLEDSLRRYQTDHLDLGRSMASSTTTTQSWPTPKVASSKHLIKPKKMGRSDSSASPVTRILHFT